MRILILEDNLDICEIYQDMLDGIDADIFVCHTLEKPLHKLIQLQPNLVLLNLDLSKAFAEIVLGFIRNHPRLTHTQVIVISDDSQLASYTAHYWGASAWLHKPILQEQLYGAICAMTS